MKLSVLIPSLLAVTFTSSATAAPPKTLWVLDHDRTHYTVHPHGGPAAPGTFDAAKRRIDAIQKGEWVTEMWLTGIVPTAELDELLDRARKRGAVVKKSGEVVNGRILGAKRYSRGDVKRARVTIENHSPYKVAVRELRFSGCAGTGTVMLAAPLSLGPTAKTTRTITIDTIVAREAIPADCMPGDLWTPTVEAVFDVSP